MQESMIKLKDKLCDSLTNSNDKEWQTVKIEIAFPPYINRGFRAAQYVKSVTGENLPIAVVNFSEELSYDIYRLIFRFNQENSYNQIVFNAKRGSLTEATIELSFSQEVDNTFQSMIPKSKRGKYLPWWKNPEEVKGLGIDLESPLPIITETEISETRKQFDKLCQRLPKEETAEPSLDGFSLERLYALFTTYLTDAANPLWDASLIKLKKDEQGVYSGILIGVYAATEEDLANGQAQSEEQPLVVITSRMKSIFEAIQVKTKAQHPAFQWDTIIVTLYRDGFVEANYELEEDEVHLE